MRFIGRAVVLALVVGFCFMILGLAPDPVLAVIAWALFGYLIRSAWGQIRSDARWVGDKLGFATRLGRPVGRFSRARHGDL